MADSAKETRTHPAYKQISRVSGQVRAMEEDEVLKRLGELKLDERLNDGLSKMGAILTRPLMFSALIINQW